MSPYGFLFDFEIHPAVSLLSKAGGDREAVSGVCPACGCEGRQHSQHLSEHGMITSAWNCHHLLLTYLWGMALCSGWG